jgi:hypothetical protein
MKTKEAPNKLYITYKGYGVFDEDSTVERTKDSQTEYTRTDAFIKKACKFLNKELPITDLSPSNMLDITFKVFDKENKKVFIEHFKNYIKGE